MKAKKLSYAHLANRVNSIGRVGAARRRISPRGPVLLLHGRRAPIELLGERRVLHGLDFAERVDAPLESSHERDEIRVADALDVGVAEREFVHLVHQEQCVGLGVGAELRHDAQDLRRLEALGERLADRENGEALREHLTLRATLGHGGFALELIDVQRTQALDEHAHLLADDAVAVGPLVDPRHHGHRLPQREGELVRRVDAKHLEQLGLRHAQKPIELHAWHPNWVLVRILHAEHEDTNLRELLHHERENLHS